MRNCSLEWEYAFREKRSATCPSQCIRLIEHIRGNKWKANWIDPNLGLIDYITTAQIIDSLLDYRFMAN